ncbi:hypothetical protein SH584_02905 [Sphingomonas sp. LY29]|uniref:hypothetical protein n=1 Tax=Sphingomonas sp. LY29 TaxID=3095341 RepID=UPI002D788EEE|nr:hypothetical protein [Sphingomonas sp. LY29]WRP26406.1 hypothetical protein SH584_02905 [Sphingomonas sp. LY29]
MKSTEGQCEACHEAAVRYFCLNHKPGLWLEVSTCPQCGARFGDPVPSRREEEKPVERPAVSPPPTRRTPRIARDTDSVAGPWSAGPTAEPRGTGSAHDPFRILIGAMTAAARARSERAARREYGETVPVRRGGGGCVGRIFMLVLFLVALFLMLPILLGAFFSFG